jgi:hypothetical protein
VALRNPLSTCFHKYIKEFLIYYLSQKNFVALRSPFQDNPRLARHVLDGLSFIGRKRMGSFLKLTLKRHMTKLNGLFLQQALQMKGFPPLWCDWITRFVQGGSVGIRVNDDI